VDDADAQLLRVLGRGRLVRLATEEELALVGLVDAGQQLHQRRLAGAVLADQREHLAGAQVEVHVLERLDAGEALGDALDMEQELGHQPVTTPLRRITLPYVRVSPVRTIR
jgi:hypothetical protein